ncbi:Mss4-like protein [Nemania sp. FL0916]|nr:Mss4-like protein [Nemania sp. FL0916]
MPEGGCLCGKIRYSVEGDPVGKALCHCLDCRKITGSTYSTNMIMPGPNFKLLAGTPKTFAKTAGSGNQIVSHFCGDCGSTLWRNTDAFGDAKIVKAGTLDDEDALDKVEPALELFTDHRVTWVGEIAGAAQKTGM